MKARSMRVNPTLIRRVLRKLGIGDLPLTDEAKEGLNVNLLFRSPLGPRRTLTTPNDFDWTVAS